MLTLTPGQNINAALARGSVHLTPGRYVQTVDVPSGVTLEGEGWRSVIAAPPGSTRPTVRTAISSDGRAPNAQYSTVRDLTIDGAGADARGIELTCNPLHEAAAGDVDFDMHHTVRDVRILNTGREGVATDGRGEIRLLNVEVYFSTGHGFLIASADTTLTNCTAGQTARCGFVVRQSGSVTITASKAFYAGRLLNGSPSPANRPSPGFWVDGCRGVTLLGAYAQDCSGAGLFAENTSWSLMSVTADSNGKGEDRAGVEVWGGDGLDVTGVAFDRSAEGGPVTQSYALRANGVGPSSRLFVPGPLHPLSDR